jgi:hypothetical protein
VIVTITFKCKNGHSNKVKWIASPQRGSSPMTELIVEQAAFERAFTSQHVCPCGAPISGSPQVNYK